MGPYAPTWPNHVRGRAGVEPPPKGVEFIALGSWPRTGERTHTMYAAPPDPKGKSPNGPKTNGCRVLHLAPKSMGTPIVHPWSGP